MNDTKLRQLVTAAVLLDREIAEKEKQLKEIKATLATEAETRAEQATATDGGGTSLVLEGDDGSVARITTAGRTLKATVKGEGKDIEKIRELAGKAFAQLFAPVLAYKPVENFRAEVAVRFGNKDAAKLIKAMENPGKTTVSFETKETTV
ncbi:MAG TPA: hypothetical protein VL357_05925 [Rariglobus sp.]|jgi:hypothetical protein|nr:hypothetical protein [Rariglobus sp.]